MSADRESFLTSERATSDFFKCMTDNKFADAIALLKKTNISDAMEFAKWLDAYGSEAPEKLEEFLKLLLNDKAAVKQVIDSLEQDLESAIVMVHYPRIAPYLTATLTLLLSICPDKQQDEYLWQFSQPQCLKVLKAAIAKLPVEKRAIITQKAILLGIEQANVSLLNTLINKEELTKLKLSPELEKEGLQLLSVNALSAEKILGVMSKFYNRNRTGDTIALKEGLMVCAAVRDRKKQRYDFNPTIMKAEELDTYMKALKAASPPIRERFIVTGSHWISVDIQIKENGKASALIVDSVGSVKLYASTADTIRSLALHFPGITIYRSDELRQTDLVSCAIYALDDVRHLFTVENYLDPKYKATGLFGYLEEHPMEPAKVNGFQIMGVRLPLPFLRSKQDSGVLNSIVARPKTEQDLAAEKSGKTAMEGAKEHLDEKVSKNANRRINYKYNKMMRYNAQFFIHVKDEKIIEQQMQSFTVEGFKKRILRGIK